MSESDKHYQDWRKLVEGQINVVQNEVKMMLIEDSPSNLTPGEFRKGQIHRVLQQTKALKALFGNGSVPSPITALENALANFLHNRRGNLDSVWSSNAALRKLIASETQMASFADIFDAHKESDEIVTLIDALVSTLHRVIDEGEEHYNSRLIKDLEKLLARAKGLKRSKLYEVGAVAEIIGRIALELAGQKAGFPGATLFMDLAKASAKLSAKVIDAMRESQNEYIRLIEIHSIEDNIDSLPELNQLPAESPKEVEDKSI